MYHKKFELFEVEEVPSDCLDLAPRVHVYEAGKEQPLKQRNGEWIHRDGQKGFFLCDVSETDVIQTVMYGDKLPAMYDYNPEDYDVVHDNTVATEVLVKKGLVWAYNALYYFLCAEA